MSLIACTGSRRRQKRKLLFIWLWMLASVFGLAVLALLQSLQRSRLHDSAATSDGSQERLSSDSVSLPPSILLHCRMYRSGIVFGSLCAPLCDEGHISDVTATFGNAHKEVTIVQCHSYCGEGQSIKAVLKHDAFSAAADGYEKEYSRMRNGSAENDVTWKESFQKLLQRHLPVLDVLRLSGDILRDMELEYSTLFNQTFSFAVRNSLTLLFRQKEYALFHAYKNKGIFPKVYGTCGPLYLVQYCEPLLNQRDSSRTALLLSSKTLPPRATNDHEGEGNTAPILWSLQSVSSSGNPAFSDEGDTRPTGSLTVVHFLHKLVTGGTYQDESESPSTGKRFSTDNNVRMEENVLAETAQSSDVTLPHSRGSDGVKVVDVDLGGEPPSRTRPSWSERAKAAAKILRFLETLEQAATFPEHVHLCDPKLEHFAVGREDGQVKLIDADRLLFEGSLTTDAASNGAGVGRCEDHKHCSDVRCRGWCRRETGRCHGGRVNNNLQAICENVFLRPSLENGAVFVHIPHSVYHDVTEALCDCAVSVTRKDGIPMQKPSARTRGKLVDVLETSVLSVTREQVTENQVPFLFQNCPSLHAV